MNYRSIGDSSGFVRKFIINQIFLLFVGTNSKFDCKNKVFSFPAYAKSYKETSLR